MTSSSRSECLLERSYDILVEYTFMSDKNLNYYHEIAMSARQPRYLATECDNKSPIGGTRRPIIKKHLHHASYLHIQHSVVLA